jgi:ring-1,2-phenylacetyl-CoA epoxidase subunit PaaE
VDVQTPTGAFRADPTEGGRHLCIAAGSGITPMLSIAATVLRNPDTQLTMFYGNRTTSSVMFAEELADLKNRYGPQLQLVHVLSREPRDVELFSGRLDADRLRRLLTTVAPAARFDHVWLCGPHAMLLDARAVLAELGTPPDRVHFELFYVDEPPPELHRAEGEVAGETTEVTVVLDGLTTAAALPRDRTVLDGAQAMRADLPFACKGGVCGTCRARVTAGSVDMRRNYALEPAEVEAGFVLTCQSYPVGEAVTVDYDA